MSIISKLFGNRSKKSKQSSNSLVDDLQRSQERNERTYYRPEDVHVSVVSGLKSFARAHRLQLSKEDQEYLLEKIKALSRSKIVDYYRDYHEDCTTCLRVPLKGMALRRNQSSFSLEEVVLQKEGKVEVTFRANRGDLQKEVFRNWSVSLVKNIFPSPEGRFSFI